MIGNMVENKLCRKCKEVKLLECFSKNKAKKDGLSTMCKLCWNVYYKENYYLRGNEKTRLIQKNKKDYIVRAELINSFKKSPCLDCNVSYPPYIMHFDHLRDKEFNISGKGKGISKDKLFAEIGKCEVICANCHAERTHKRLHNKFL